MGNRDRSPSGEFALRAPVQGRAAVTGDLDQVAQRLGVEAGGVDVDVDAAAGVDPRPGAPHRADE